MSATVAGASEFNYNTPFNFLANCTLYLRFSFPIEESSHILSSTCNNYMSYSWVWISAGLVWYIGECMLSIININNGVNVSSTFGH
jgi:hypothetical protein